MFSLTFTLQTHKTLWGFKHCLIVLLQNPNECTLHIAWHPKKRDKENSKESLTMCIHMESESKMQQDELHLKQCSMLESSVRRAVCTTSNRERKTLHRRRRRCRDMRSENYYHPKSASSSSPYSSTAVYFFIFLLLFLSFWRRPKSKTKKKSSRIVDRYADCRRSHIHATWKTQQFEMHTEILLYQEDNVVAVDFVVFVVGRSSTTTATLTMDILFLPLVPSSRIVYSRRLLLPLLLTPRHTHARSQTHFDADNHCRVSVNEKFSTTTAMANVSRLFFSRYFICLFLLVRLFTFWVWASCCLWLDLVSEVALTVSTLLF